MTSMIALAVILFMFGGALITEGMMNSSPKKMVCLLCTGVLVVAFGLCTLCAIR